MKKHPFVWGFVVGCASFGVLNQISLAEAPIWMILVAAIVIAFGGVEVWNRIEG